MEVGVAGTRGAGSTDRSKEHGKPADSRRAGDPYAEEQGTLFGADDDGSDAGRGESSGTAEPGPRGDDAGAAGPSGAVAAGLDVDAVDIGYRGPTACSAAGITYRQLDYWARTGLVEPSVRGAHGSGSQRLYSFRDILVLKVVKRLLDTGISLQQIRAAVHHLRDHGTSDLAEVTLMSDGVSVYECTSPDEVVDLLQGGQGVFGIALGRVWQEVEGNLAELPAVRAEDGLLTVGQDELSRRRASRTG
jgi:DNA-binding transcriptional MerR regulator